MSREEVEETEGILKERKKKQQESAVVFLWIEVV